MIEISSCVTSKGQLSPLVSCVCFSLWFVFSAFGSGTSGSGYPSAAAAAIKSNLSGIPELQTHHGTEGERGEGEFLWLSCGDVGPHVALCVCVCVCVCQTATLRLAGSSHRTRSVFVCVLSGRDVPLRPAGSSTPSASQAPAILRDFHSLALAPLHQSPLCLRGKRVSSCDESCVSFVSRVSNRMPEEK